MGLWEAISNGIEANTGLAFAITQQRVVGGGCINESYLISDTSRQFFVKINQAAMLEMFEAEADGLCELASAGAIRVPAVIASGRTEGRAWLVLEALELGSRGNAAELGRQLAALHRQQADGFGWWRDNHIGSSPQSNRWHANWAGFWAEQRLAPQLAMAAGRGGTERLQSLGERLLAALPALFEGYRPLPSLLHGDLWSGNYSYTGEGEPVLFDPAVYYGDRETDLAMTELFGGFAADFYAAYHAAWPLDAGYATRKTLYNLYHVLNHCNLFGGGYAGQAEQMMQRLLAELGA
ncbi:MAG: fructosamine kinase family protein [Gammaproteobacteria bacterium]|nr:fructosamine kinase family protein [Gammaproteobacteria bacterium]